MRDWGQTPAILTLRPALCSHWPLPPFSQDWVPPGDTRTPPFQVSQGDSEPSLLGSRLWEVGEYVVGRGRTTCRNRDLLSLHVSAIICRLAVPMPLGPARNYIHGHLAPFTSKLEIPSTKPAPALSVAQRRSPPQALTPKCKDSRELGAPAPVPSRAPVATHIPGQLADSFSRAWLQGTACEGQPLMAEVVGQSHASGL